MTAERRMSSRQASLRARYSSRDKMRGGAISYLGWETLVAGLVSMKLFLAKNRKNDLMELILREMDLAVYLSFLR